LDQEVLIMGKSYPTAIAAQAASDEKSNKIRSGCVSRATAPSTPSLPFISHQEIEAIHRRHEQADLEAKELAKAHVYPKPQWSHKRPHAPIGPDLGHGHNPFTGQAYPSAPAPRVERSPVVAIQSEALRNSAAR